MDIVHDAPRNLLYITSGDSVLRYNLATNSFLSPFVLGGTLRGMDISPIGNTLVVADHAATTGAESWVYVVDLATGTSNRSQFPRAFYEAGTYTVAFGNDGKALVTSNFAGSGSVPLRKFDPDTNSWSALGSVNQRTMVTSSGDGSVIGFAESNLSSGPVGLYRVSDGSVSRYWSTTGWFNYEIGVNTDGTQFAVPTYGGTFVFDANRTKIATIGQYAGQQPVGVAYHPVEPVVYFAWSQGTNVTAHETGAFTQVATFNFESTNGTNGNNAFQNGRLKLSRDGSLLFSTVPNGVRYVRQYASLSAESVETTINEDDADAPVTLGGSIGNGGILNYQVLTEPEHGTLTGTPPNVTYTPIPNFHGTDSFTYAVDYGQAGAEASVSITVNSIEDVPVADAQALITNEDTAKAIILLGSDAENSALTYSIASPPSHGTLTGVAPNVTYTPNANYFGPDSFSFKVSDGSAESAAANIAITVTSVNDAPAAANDAATTIKNSAVTISVLANDSDADADALTVTATAQGSNGTTAIINGGTAIRFTPKPNYVGADTFTYTISDGRGGSATATVQVTVKKK